MMRALSVGLLVVLGAPPARGDDRCSADQWCTVSTERMSVGDVARDVTKGHVIALSYDGLHTYDGTTFAPMAGTPVDDVDYLSFTGIASAGGVVWATRHNSIEDTSDPVTGELVTLKNGTWVVRKTIKKFSLDHLVAVSAAQGWAVGGGDLSKPSDDRSDERAVIVRWDGKRTKVFWPKGVDSISDVAAVSAKEAWFTCRKGLGRVDAKGNVTWLPVPKAALFEREAHYHHVHRAGPDDLYVLGTMGVVHYHKGKPTMVALPHTGSGKDTRYTGIESSSPTDITIVDEMGKALHYDGTGWTLEIVGQSHLQQIVRTGDGTTLIFGDRLVKHAPRP